MNAAAAVGVLGATSLVGDALLPLLVAAGRRVIACSRSPRPAPADGAVRWTTPGGLPAGDGPVPHWVALCPLWALGEHLGWLADRGVRRLVALSSMSLFTKRHAPAASERRVARRLEEAEAATRDWARAADVTLCLLRPTMIYDGRADGNISAIAEFVRRRGWFPLCGRAAGLRQPVHAADVARACVAALEHPAPREAYALSGGEALPFCDLVRRVCRERGLPERLVSVPPWAWRAALPLARGLGLARSVPVGAGPRMNEDLSCDHAAATADLGFHPRGFLAADATSAVSEPAAVAGHGEGRR